MNIYDALTGIKRQGLISSEAIQQGYNIGQYSTSVGYSEGAALYDLSDYGGVGLYIDNGKLYFFIKECYIDSYSDFSQGLEGYTQYDLIQSLKFYSLETGEEISSHELYSDPILTNLWGNKPEQNNWELIEIEDLPARTDLLDYNNPFSDGSYPPLSYQPSHIRYLRMREVGASGDRTRSRVVWFCPYNHLIESFSCFIKGQKVTLADGSLKNIEDIQVGDKIPYVTNSGEKAETFVVLPPHKGPCNSYTNYIWDDGTVLKIYKEQGLWHVGANDYRNCLLFKVGDQTKTIDNKILTLTAIEEVESEEELEHYFLWTYNGNYNVEKILTCTDRAKGLRELYKPENKQYRDMIDPDLLWVWRKQLAERSHKLHPEHNRKVTRYKHDMDLKIDKANSEISNNKHYLSVTDYNVIKYAEGLLTDEVYLPIKTARQEARDRINELELSITNLQSDYEKLFAKYKSKMTRPYYPAQQEDTQILMFDDSYKAIKDLNAGDMVKYKTEDGNYSFTEVTLTPVEEFVWEYAKYKFSDGTELIVSDEQNPFCRNFEANRSPISYEVGDVIQKVDGSTATVEEKENVRSERENIFYRLVTQSGGYVVNNIPYQVDITRIEEELRWEENK